MKLTDVIKIWDRIHVLDVGELGFCDLEKAIGEVVGVEDNVEIAEPVEGPFLEAGMP